MTAPAGGAGEGTMSKRSNQLLTRIATAKNAVGQTVSPRGYLAATAAKGKTLERLVASEQKLPNPPVVLTQVGQSAQRVGDGRVVAVAGPVDFTGTVRGSGRAILFDCKECGLDRFVCSTSTVKQHQVEELVRHGRAGAIAGLLTLNTAVGDVHWLDWRRLEVRLPSYPWALLPKVGTLFGVRWKLVAAAAEGEGKP